MKYLFIHKHLPGQFEHVLRSLSSDPRNEVVCIGQEYKPQQSTLQAPRVLIYQPPAMAGGAFREFLRNFEEAVGNGLAVAAKLKDLSRAGFVPDIAFAHLGWGESLYFKDIFPDTPLIGYCEFYHHAQGADAGFDPEFPMGLNDTFRIRTMNAAKLLGLAGIDIGVSPTLWQRSLFPAEFQRKITVIHEGVDTARIRPDPAATFRLPNGAVLGREQTVVTYATRNLEPYRGFHVFMRAVAELSRRRRDCQFVIAGGDEVSYSAVASGGTYREKLLREVEIDPRRVHFVGRLPFEDYLRLLQISTVHVYLTVPFVLSWSLLEAMSAGCVIVASDTAPVREVLRHGHNGLLADFFSPREIADMVERVLNHPGREKDLGSRARADIIGDYDAAQSGERYRKLIDRLLSNRAQLRSICL
jgi:glycosyltransferase involved in cell wall biosynthesis